MKTLPDTCATTNLEGAPVMIKKGTEGYWPMYPRFNVETYNEMVGADEEVVKAMTCASMFGWDIPAVTNYEES